jgi:glycosyltransferase involved in cell wall biosynthesis
VTSKTILYVVNAKVPEEIRAEKICSALANMGNRVIIACKWSGEDLIRETKQGYLVCRIGKDKRLATCFPGNPIWTNAINDLVHDFKPDIIICREMIPLLSCTQAAKGRNIPIILDMAEHYPAAMREWKKYSQNPLSRFFVHTLPLPELIESHAVKHADAIITVCEEQNQRLQSQYSYPKEALFIVHNTPEKSIFNDVIPRCNIPPITFGHHGYFTLERNLENLVLGFDIAAKRFPDITLLLAGTGETLEDVSRLVQTVSSRDRIHLTGPYKAKDLSDLYNRTDIGILPYAEQEFRQFTLPNKAFDYMACGKPIISSGLLPMKRLLDETGAGIYGPCSSPEDISLMIERMMESDIQTMSARGHQAFLSKYHWENEVEQLQSALFFVSKK